MAVQLALAAALGEVVYLVESAYPTLKNLGLSPATARRTWE